MRQLVCVGLLFGLFVTVIGCGGPGTNKLTGKVTLDGSPMPNGALQFYPPNATVPAFSVNTKDDGTFEAIIPGDANLPTGSYTVTAAKYELKKGSKMTVGEGMDMAQLAMTGNATNVLPKKFSSPKDSPLKYEVKFPTATGDLAITSK
ncbi:hypothetical protein [Tuwongella immobilis]|uniref:Carboxypeptidase regulatory-like domain-containing protein n=1 Tax=Tuwongella immobilis TaxID=692036 RepID=A0A6C2YL55_9BACT|nr:hypothetical protein [Tuwongella immobilis]VIP01835.1 Uncharacterized protein OS=Blastopirellula marina DSM 3645 GN=DSM3645_16785 PE=4 SV=1 [Tuwongella immobilis]VTR99593.1 Uncharacterized protein OS=Blastopirellula marina DSM 3645 GN=DSM3645_16785 PE=4 SV=1 [Tuwongella immobilis]